MPTKFLPTPRKAPLINGHRPRGKAGPKPEERDDRLEERFATAGNVPTPKLPIDSSLIPWDEIFALKGFPNPDGILLPDR